MSFNISYNFIAKDSFSAAANKIKRSTSKMKQSFKGLKRTAANTASEIKRMGTGLKGFVSKIMTMKGIIFGAIGYKIFNVLKSFSAAMNQVKAVSGATETQFKKLRDQAKELGRTTQFTATQAAEAQSFLAKAGFKVDKIYAAMPHTLNLAAAAQMDMGSAADIVSNIMSGFGMEADQLGGAVDVLAKAFTSSNVDLRMLGDSMKYAAPVAKGFGVTFQETAAAVGIMGNAGIQGSMAGRALKNMLIALKSPTKSATREMKKMGLTVDKNNISISEVLIKLKKSGATPEKIMKVFGKIAGPSVLAMMDQGINKMKEMKDALAESGGTANKIATTQMQGLSGAVKKMTSAFEGLIITYGDSGFDKMLTNIINLITKLTNALSTLLNSDVYKKLQTGFEKMGRGLLRTTGIGQVFDLLSRKGIKYQDNLSSTENMAKDYEKRRQEAIDLAPIASLGLGNNKKDSMNGILDINIKDKANNVESSQIKKVSGLNLGVSTVGGSL